MNKSHLTKQVRQPMALQIVVKFTSWTESMDGGSSTWLFKSGTNGWWFFVFKPIINFDVLTIIFLVRWRKSMSPNGPNGRCRFLLILKSLICIRDDHINLINFGCFPAIPIGIVLYSFGFKKISKCKSCLHSCLFAFLRLFFPDLRLFANIKSNIILFNEFVSISFQLGFGIPMITFLIIIEIKIISTLIVVGNDYIIVKVVLVACCCCWCRNKKLRNYGCDFKSKRF
ncbi:hypothetical protein BLOT_012734 [Blomia tropicalis]|nr:hypothetical protein BLOT_012734 [Blomia tropicalis]